MKTLPGVSVLVGGEFSFDTTLNEFIRRYANLPGTKYMCMEGGCGACIYHVRTVQPGSHEYAEYAVNSVSTVIILLFQLLAEICVCLVKVVDFSQLLHGI